MPRRTLHIVIAALVLGGTAFGSLPSMAVTPPAPAGLAVAKAVPVGSFGRDMSCVSTTFCVAAGGRGFLRFDGQAWHPMPYDLGQQIDSVDCLSTSFCAAIGLQTLNLWNGQAWSAAPPWPVPASMTGRPSRVACVSATDCFVITYTDSHTPPILRWRNGSWTVYETLSPTGTVRFESITCTSASSCLVAGKRRYTDSHSKAIVEGWNGTSWSVESTPATPDGVSDELADVSCGSPSFCVGVGYTTTRTGITTLAMKRTGTIWATVPSPNLSSDVRDNNRLFGVDCPSEGSCLAVGGMDVWRTGTNAYTPLATAWGGSGFTVDVPVQNDRASSDDTELQAVSCVSPTSCAAVNDSSTGAPFLVQSIPAAPFVTDLPASAEAYVGDSWSADVHVYGIPQVDSVLFGGAPSWLSVVPDGTDTWLLVARPPRGSGGLYPVTLTMHSSFVTTTSTLALTVLEPPHVTSRQSFTQLVGHWTDFELTASGFPQSHFTIESGTLPPGLQLVHWDAARIVGRPSPGSEGTYSLRIRAENGDGVFTISPLTITIR